MSDFQWDGCLEFVRYSGLHHALSLPGGIRIVT
jgi:hypothetical protein